MSEISVIIPVYKSAKYLPQCLNSVFNQTFNDYEVILVSDGPEEDDLLCQQYVQQDERIKFYKGENKGLGGARNIGIDVAQGEYIYFLDADDFISNDYLERMINGIKEAIGFIDSKDDVNFTDLKRFEYAYVIYDLNHRKNMDLIKAYFEKEGVYLNGRFGSFEYLNMDAIIRQSKTLSEKIKPR